MGKSHLSLGGEATPIFVTVTDPLFSSYSCLSAAAHSFTRIHVNTILLLKDLNPSHTDL